MADAVRGNALRFRHECRDFVRFVRHPRLGPRLPGRAPQRACIHMCGGPSLGADWFSGLSPARIVQWAALLWGWNLLFLGPLALVAAYVGGAQHRLLDMASIPWLQALLWAPVVEELLFRYGLRRPAQALWLVPVAAVVLAYGVQWSTALLLLAAVAVLMRQHHCGQPLSWARRKVYRRAFPWVFYLATTLFALLHLLNFKLHQTPLWLLPLLVLPQWCTGLVLGWMRVRRGIGAAMLLHATFNGGPLLLVWLLVWLLPGAYSLY